MNILRYTIYSICFCMIGILMSCTPEETRQQQQGRMQQTIQNNTEQVTYQNFLGEETDRVEVQDWDGKRLYRIMEKNSSNLWQDTRPIQCLLVGIDSYPNNHLRFCREDILLLQRYLEHFFVQYQQPCTFTILFDQKATKSNLIQAIQKQTEQSSQFSTTIFAFSGHGKNDGIQLYDQDISSSELQKYFVANNSSRLIWIMDACHIGMLEEDLEQEFKTRPAFAEIYPARRASKAYIQPQRNHDLYPNSSPYPFAHIWMGRGKILLLSSRSNEEAKDGVFLRSLVKHLESMEQPFDFPKIIQQIQESIIHYNYRCRPEHRLDMTPQVKLYGDVQMWVMPWMRQSP